MHGVEVCGKVESEVRIERRGGREGEGGREGGREGNVHFRSIHTRTWMSVTKLQSHYHQHKQMALHTVKSA